MSHYSIRDLETFTGIKAHTIRIWEKRYQIVEPARTDTNIRFYDDEDLKRLLNVSILNRHGFKISEITKLSPQEIAEKILQVTVQSVNVNNYIESLVIAMIELNEEQFDKTLTSLIIKMGFEDAVLKALYPLFERIGVLWQVGSILPAQEHFISALIRQKMIVAIDGITAPRRPESKTCVLFLPENEWHELGILFCSYLLKKAGHTVIYLGQSVPIGNLAIVVKKHKVDFLITQLVSAKSADEINEMLSFFAAQFPEQKILIGGNQILEKEIACTGNIVAVPSILALRQVVDSQ
jgi:DNA-binding transcriptional MerR regulator/methylmalonyl-CoA mutase cobalamin-binding subunit